MFEAHSLFFFPRYWQTERRSHILQEGEREKRKQKTGVKFNKKIEIIRLYTTATYNRARAQTHTPASSSSQSY